MTGMNSGLSRRRKNRKKLSEILNNISERKFQSIWKRKIEELGFEFLEEEIIPRPVDWGDGVTGFLFRGLVHCYCGKYEKFLVSCFDIGSQDFIDEIYQQLYENSFNEQHLRNDGFSEEQLEQIRTRRTDEEINNCSIA